MPLVRRWPMTASLGPRQNQNLIIDQQQSAQRLPRAMRSSAPHSPATLQPQPPGLRLRCATTGSPPAKLYSHWLEQTARWPNRSWQLPKAPTELAMGLAVAAAKALFPASLRQDKLQTSQLKQTQLDWQLPLMPNSGHSAQQSAVLELN